MYACVSTSKSFSFPLSALSRSWFCPLLFFSTFDLCLSLSLFFSLSQSLLHSVFISLNLSPSLLYICTITTLISVHPPLQPHCPLFPFRDARYKLPSYPFSPSSPYHSHLYLSLSFTISFPYTNSSPISLIPSHTTSPQGRTLQIGRDWIVEAFHSFGPSSELEDSILSHNNLKSHSSKLISGATPPLKSSI